MSDEDESNFDFSTGTIIAIALTVLFFLGLNIVVIAEKLAGN